LANSSVARLATITGFHAGRDRTLQASALRTAPSGEHGGFKWFAKAGFDQAVTAHDSAGTDEAKARVRHRLALSVVRTDRLQESANDERSGIWKGILGVHAEPADLQPLDYAVTLAIQEGGAHD
jgi:hypothetical protein